MTDVLQAINSSSDIEVRAYVSGYGIVVEDVSGGDESDLIIADADGTHQTTLEIAI